MSDEAVVYSSLNLAEVHLVRSLLTREGIGSRVRRQFLAPLMGEIPADDARAELMVSADRLDAARAVIDAALAADQTERDCPACGEPNPGGFELCWSCGADLPMAGDPVVLPGGG